MKKLITACLALVILGPAIAQELKQVTLSGGSRFAHFGLLVDRTVLIRIADDGKMLEYGTEEQSNRINNYYSPTLRPYIGRVENWGPEADSLARGRVKYIGSAQISYYPSYEEAYRRGKIRAIGNMQFDYYREGTNPAQVGKLKMMGRHAIDFYSSYDNEAIKGKLKTVGTTNIVYYTSFDDKAIAGKVKMIGGSVYTWYTSLEQRGMGGSLKSGAPRQMINDVIYIVQ